MINRLVLLSDAVLYFVNGFINEMVQFVRYQLIAQFSTAE